MRAESLPAAPWRLVAALTAIAACSSGGDGGNDPTGSFTISVNPAALSVVQGESGQATVTLTRVDGFAGAVAFTVQGAPTGVTGSVSGGGAAAVSTGTVTIAVGAGVAPGTYNLTLRATASGLTDRTAAVALTVTASGGFTIATTLPGLTVTQGGTGTGTVTLTRTGSFAGAVGLSVAGVPAGVTAVFDPTGIAVGTTSADLDFTAGGAVTTGAYPLVITATAAGLPNATANFTLTIVQNPGAGSFTLSANPSPIEIPQGASGQTTITVTRADGFTGAVTLALTTTSANISATFQPATIPAGSTTSVVTINVPPIPAAPPAGREGPSATPLGDYHLVFTGTAPGVSNATVNLTVSVSPAPGGSFIMQIVPPSGTVQAGSSTISTLTVTRTAPFVGGVSFTVAGTPPSATVGFAPIAITAGGTTTQVTFFTSTATPAGVYPIVITGIGDGVNIPNTTTTYTLTVTPPPPGPGALSFQFCDPARAPVWFAYQVQAGVGPWTRVIVGANTTYSADFGGSTGGVAWVEPDGSGGFHTQVTYSSEPGLQALAAANCAKTSGKTVTGSVVGLGLTDQALISLGTSGTVATFGLPNFTIRWVPTGNRTLMATRSSLTLPSGAYTTNKVILTRSQNFADGAVIPPINFDTEGFAPTFHALTVNNLLGWAHAAGTQYFTDNGGSSGSLVTSGSGSSFPSIPGVHQIAGDFHFVTATAYPSTMDLSQFRSVGRFFFTGGAQDLTFGAILANPSVVSLIGGNYARLMATGAVQSDYGRYLSLSYSQTGRTATVTMTGSPFVLGNGDPNYNLAFPDFSGLPGWLDSWMPATGVPTNWNLFAQSWDGSGHFGGLPVEGERVWTAGKSGQLTP